MNILYIHGLNGSLSPEKQSILQQYGNVLAPAIDYENNPDSIMWLHNHYKDAKIDLIIGSSMGGFAGYYLCKLFKVPALLFNPALAYRSVYQNEPSTPSTNEKTIHIILGAKDEVVDPKSTMNFLGNLLTQPQDYNIHVRHDLEHRIPIDVFEAAVSNRMKSLSV